MDERLEQLERRIEALEAQALLFEEHRRAWITLNSQLKLLLDEMQGSEGAE
jgi:hypothetical protein